MKPTSSVRQVESAVAVELPADPPASIPEQWRTLHERYQHVGDAFSARELAHLRFMRWLYQSGQIEP